MSIANEIASTLQTASLKRHPDPAYDANPSTAASQKKPVTLSQHHTELDEEPQSHPSHAKRVHVASSAEDQTSAENAEDTDEGDIPLSILRPLPRRRAAQPTLPPLPDLRFEQSYLARIAPYIIADDVPDGSKYRSYAMIGYITLLDHVLMPLTQGVVWNLAVFGWRNWNTGVKFNGRGVGARVRRWWWGVNGWAVPARE